MYLRSLKIKNFRKFGETDNVVEFVDSGNPIKRDKTINLAPATTLIVGKNNSGKTTITKALEKIVKGHKFESNDFNFFYLHHLLNEYKTKIKEETFEDIIKYPLLEFEVLVGIDSNGNDLLTNVVPFMIIENTQETIDTKKNNKKNDMKLNIIVKYEIKEQIEFKSKVKNMILNTDVNEEEHLFNKFLDLLTETKFETKCYGSDGKEVRDFKISNLIDIRIIAANKSTINNLTKTFNNIIEYRYKSKDTPENLNELNKEISEINKKVTLKVSDSHSGAINGILHKIESNDRLSVKLSSDLNLNKVMNNLLKYEYVEEGLNIPEGQFGLGYSNLMSIVGDLIDYIEQYPKQEFHSKINLICIEEPEAFMHPQMQELFIKNINDAVSALLENTDKKINSQLIITTHSSHILNSKIHSGNSFDNINYITIINKYSSVVNLTDEKVTGNQKFPDELDVEFTERKNNDLKFLKKHIKYKVSELFFSDAVIFVEGVTEENLLPYYIEQNEDLNKKYISVFNINGAHGLVYHPLIKLLKIPTLIITDLDIQRDKNEKENFEQIISLKGKVTTNQTIILNNQTKNISKLEEYFEQDNLYIVFQKEKIESYFATSFEEALILTNYKNSILNELLKKMKPDIYKTTVGLDLKKLKDNSYKFQRKLSSSKSDFSNEILYKLITKKSTDTLLELPAYINDGLTWLKKKLEVVNE